MTGHPTGRSDRRPGAPSLSAEGADDVWSTADAALCAALGEPPGTLEIKRVRDARGQVRLVIARAEDAAHEDASEPERRRLEEQLRRSQRMDAVGRMAGGIAHDFNNMLAVILNYADFARQRVAGDPVADGYLAAIAKAASRSAALTRQLMIFARKDVVAPRKLQLDTVVAEMDPLIRRTLGEDIELHVVSHQGVRPVEMAPSHAEQVLMNLVVNARDAMPRGGHLLIETSTVEVGADDAWRYGVGPGTWVRLVVEDTGTGMAPEVLQVAFEPFFTTKSPGQGTGLGLSIVYGIVVEEAKGHVHVDSTPGVGTTFYLFFPPTEPAVEAPAPAREEPPPLGRGERVVVAEDEPAVRAIAVHLLEQAGYRVQSADDAEAALRLCHRADLLLTDVVMPKMSGSELARRAREIQPRLRVLYMSGHQADRVARQDVGAFVSKPFGAAELLWAVHRALRAD